MLVAQSCLTPCDPMYCSPPGSSAHGISQARILGWIAISPGVFLTQGSNSGLPHCGQTLYRLSHQEIPALVGGFFTTELPGKPSPVFLKRSLVFPILLSSSTSFHCSLAKAFLCLLAILWNSAFSCVYLSLSPLPLGHRLGLFCC